jgi:pterin-4a-carbinolamine dehydratase
VTLSLWSHDAGGITARDFTLAAAVGLVDMGGE